MAEKHQSVEAALRMAEAHARRGEAGKAMQICTAILAQSPMNVRASALLTALRATGAKRLPAGNPDGNPRAELNDLIALHRQGPPDEVQRRAAALAQRYPGNPVIPNILGASLAETGKSDEAIASFTRALKIDPNFYPAHTNLGAELARRGRVDEAIAHHAAALEVKPDYAEAHHNLGSCLTRLGRLSEAVDSFSRALELRPNLVETRRSLGAALHGLGRDAEAAEHYAAAVELNPDDAELRNSLGVALNAVGRHDEAIASYRDALRLKPDLREAYTNLCELYEKTNRLEDLRRAVAQAQAEFDRDDPYHGYWLAVLAFKEEKFPEARDHLDSIAPDRLALKMQVKHSELLGKTHDRLEQFGQAFAQFTETNRLAAEGPSARGCDRASYIDALRELNDDWSRAPRSGWADPAPARDRVPLAFLVGFPRSGTTLLDTMLRGHPRISVLEEAPTVDRVRDALGCAPTFAALDALTEGEIHRLRSVYLEEVARLGGETPPGHLVVDKLPLNIVHAGLVHRVFPEAKFILALRHPCDCVLSCFIQNFALNDAMANFLDLGHAAEFYDLAMRLWRSYCETLGLESIQVKYETLVKDPESELAPLLGFLGLDWHDNVLDHRTTALARGRINTPSYNQVTQDLYSHASGRWENYRSQLAPVLPVLGPWAAEWGYTI